MCNYHVLDFKTGKSSQKILLVGNIWGIGSSHIVQNNNLLSLQALFVPARLEVVLRCQLPEPSFLRCSTNEKPTIFICYMS